MPTRAVILPLNCTRSDLLAEVAPHGLEPREDIRGGFAEAAPGVDQGHGTGPDQEVHVGHESREGPAAHPIDANIGAGVESRDRQERIAHRVPICLASGHIAVTFSFFRDQQSP